MPPLFCRQPTSLDAMKAWQLSSTDGIDSYQLEDIEVPSPGPGEVRIKLKVAGINHLDLWVSKGLPAPHSFPHVGGADGAGIIDAVGDGVAGFEPGDEVIVDPSISCGACPACRNDEIVYCDSFQIIGEHRSGTFTEQLVVPAINAVRKPARLDWDSAGTFGLAGVTALRMLEKARLRDSETVLVVGVGGGVSASAVRLALGLGARVFVTSRSPEKIAEAIGLGAEGGFDSTSEFGAAMNALGGADLVVDNVGTATLKQSMRAARKGGRIAICGATSGAKIELTLPVLWFRQLELIGSSMGSHAQFQRALHYFSQGPLPAPPTQMFDFDQLPDALRFVEAGSQAGNVGLRF